MSGAYSSPLCSRIPHLEVAAIIAYLITEFPHAFFPPAIHTFLISLQFRPVHSQLGVDSWFSRAATTRWELVILTRSPIPTSSLDRKTGVVPPSVWGFFCSLFYSPSTLKRLQYCGEDVGQRDSGGFVIRLGGCASTRTTMRTCS